MKSQMNSVFKYLLPAMVPVLISCNTRNLDENAFLQKNGTVSIETENGDSLLNWVEKIYYTGIGIEPDLDDPALPNHVDYTISFEESGTVYMHYLGNRERNTDPADNVFLASLLDLNYQTVDSAFCTFKEINAPVWTSLESDTKKPIQLSVPGKGTYLLRISTIRGSDFYLDKIVLSDDSGFLPSGTGPVETTIKSMKSFKRDSIILPPQWAFGVLYGGYTNHWQSLEVIDSLINGDFPIDAYWIDSYFWDFNQGEGPGGYIDFVGDTTAFPDVQELWDQFEKRKIKAGIWIWNLIQQDGNEEAYKEFLDRGYFSNTYINRNGWHNETENTPTGSIDFDNPEAVDYWKKKLQPFFDRGLDFLKLDNSSDISFCKAAFEATQDLGKETNGRGFILAHLHTTYDYRHKLYPTKWTGDAKITWSQPDYPNNWVYAMGGLKENVGMVADPAKSTYEIPFLSHDAGGYDYFGSEDQSEELYTRWIQFSALNSIMMFFSTAKNPTRNHPYRYSTAVQDNFRKYTHLRMRLFPYIYSYALETHLTGQKMIRGMHGKEYQYLFGEELLIAPVFEQGARERVIYLPEGNWIDPESGREYSGNTEIILDAPLDKLPMLIRKGAIIPMRKYERSVELGTNDTLYLEIYPGEEISSFDLYEDDGTSNDYLQDRYCSTKFSVKKDEGQMNLTINQVEGNYQGLKDQRYYIIRFHADIVPQNVKINDGIYKNWEYSAQDGITQVFLQADKHQRNQITLLY